MRGHSFILNVDCDIKRYIIENHMFVIEKLDEKNGVSKTLRYNLLYNIKYHNL